MELLYFFGLLMIVAKSDAAVTFTVPQTDGTPACATMGSAAEGTQTGTVVTPAATATPAGTITYGLVAGGDSANFEMADTATGVVTIKSDAALDYETQTSYTVIITGNDGADTSATCTIAITDVQPWFSSLANSVIVPEAAANGDAITTLSCTDGAGTITLAMTGGDDSTVKFAFDTGTGALTKSANAFDATTKSSYLLTFTCVDNANTATTTVTVCINNESNCPSSNKASINSGVLAGLIVPALLAIYRLS